MSGADAHAWPQVYLGSAGWVSFEPTPQELTGEVAPEGVVGPTARGPVVPPTGPSTTVAHDDHPRPSHDGSPHIDSRRRAQGRVACSTRRRRPRGVRALVDTPRTRWLPPWSFSWSCSRYAGVAVRRQDARRPRRPGAPPRPSTGPCDRVGSPRPPWQPLPTFVDELSERLEGALTRRVVEVDLADQLRGLLADAAVVAMVAERALYGPDDVDAASARRAQHSLMRFRRALRQPRGQPVLVTRNRGGCTESPTPRDVHAGPERRDSPMRSIWDLPGLTSPGTEMLGMAGTVQAWVTAAGLLSGHVLRTSGSWAAQMERSRRWRRRTCIERTTAPAPATRAH